MAKEIAIFKRVEKKYLLTLEQHKAFMDMIADKIIPDDHGKSTIQSLYLDTPDFRLIRASIDAKGYKESVYQEKLRLRSYGVPSDDSQVFLEIKKKFKGVVYKRRVSMKMAAAIDYLENGIIPKDSQIMREIDYAMRYYGHPKPAALLCYEREAYYVKDLPTHRITFDTNVRYRDFSLDLRLGNKGECIQPPNTVLMEIKTDGAMPLWLSAALDQCKIYPATFSKYGTAYRLMFHRTREASNNQLLFPVIGQATTKITL